MHLKTKITVPSIRIFNGSGSTICIWFGALPDSVHLFLKVMSRDRALAVTSSAS